ncbi:hypothetical protein GQ53DRAFT_96943 [Thozetella sp. PMI_491]|nr:hypothetical protein GQ53DRAFT_96943 [Thozetella sp. PMI_491]
MNFLTSAEPVPRPKPRPCAQWPALLRGREPEPGARVIAVAAVHSSSGRPAETDNCHTHPLPARAASCGLHLSDTLQYLQSVTCIRRSLSRRQAACRILPSSHSVPSSRRLPSVHDPIMGIIKMELSINRTRLLI